VVTKRSRAHHDRSVRPVLRAVAPKIEGTTVALTDGGPPVGREELPMKWYVCVALLLVACSDNNDNDNDNHIVTRTDIVTDATDPSLINAWGLAFNPMGVAWVSSNGAGVSEVFDANGNHVLPPITIPGPARSEAGGDSPSAPTGQAFNGNGAAFLGDEFIFGTEDGTISGWQPAAGSAAAMRVDNSAIGAVYKGVAIGQANNGDARLFAADFSNGTVDVFDSNFLPVAGGFIDTQLPAGFAPFNVAVIQGDVLVSYALQDATMTDDVAGIGNGFIDAYDGDGNLLSRLISGGDLNSPWGMVMSPSSFGAASNSLIVGNFGDGLIHVFNLDFDDNTAKANGTLNDPSGAPIVIDGLWALQFGPGAGNFFTNTLYFTAGPMMETQGVFGMLNSTTKP
jgi:uncharacterized protein (TIGR03118 family)